MAKKRKVLEELSLDESPFLRCDPRLKQEVEDLVEEFLDVFTDEGRAVGRKKTLQWSLVSSPGLSPPLYLTFLDAEDNILEEFHTPITDLYNKYGSRLILYIINLNY